MRKSAVKTFLTLLLAFIIGFSSVPLATNAASMTPQEKTEQKKQAKKFNKHLKKYFTDDNSWHYEITYKKKKNHYEFTMSCQSKELSRADIEATKQSITYTAMLETLRTTSKDQYKVAKKKYKLKKPVMYVIWISSDGYQMAKFKNGKQIE